VLQLTSWVLLRGSKEVEITGSYIANQTCDLWYYSHEIMGSPPYGSSLESANLYLFWPLNLYPTAFKLFFVLPVRSFSRNSPLNRWACLTTRLTTHVYISLLLFYAIL